VRERRSKLQKKILSILANGPKKLQREIAEEIGAHPSSVNRSIKKIIGEGLILKVNYGYVLACKMNKAKNVTPKKKMIKQGYKEPIPMNLRFLDELNKIHEVMRRNYYNFENISMQISNKISEIRDKPNTIMIVDT